ncbi:MAG: hypothetical protein COV30_01720 [Candidatus Yanofskybacteria bacterium CG10_big_fil_rev_8_21_14_0_10_37_15]|uniref:Proline--tRNA ligase n=1 Tax=Candidatus Yanofskybacteria bacterium CG10_big_fil_rev_8_21_14_0_10_37_15 TaxID=1975097 RepID=A0A2H0R5Y3_9BACT|nr:MAG: hypothetical protein COV30_01720 [Candidatus Yanofskybacteria bacterium CG10_big_fil_rev_8_21_14_0_10_37_15]
MRLSQLFTKTLREAPADEMALNAQYLIRGGFISKVMSGVYEYLPLGWRVLNKINKIIREEMDAIDGQELYMSVLQDKETWTTTGRWDSAKEVMYQFKDNSGKDFGLGWTHEEPLTKVARHFIGSYRDLPKAVYQIQTKFRNEPRAKSGLLRGREFLMKDLYSFHATERDLDEYYEKVAEAYKNIFRRTGVKAIRTLASGGLFSKFSDEFQVLSDVGEDTVFICQNCDYASNAEVAEKNGICPKCFSKDLGQTDSTDSPQVDKKMKEEKSIEVGNIFKLGSKFSTAFELNYIDEKGQSQPVMMASYGIGPSRLMATVVETNNDFNGIIWPESIAPYKAHLIVLDDKKEESEKLYRDMMRENIEVLYDDREDKTAGEKFADADLIGCPIRIVISRKTLEKNSAEIKKRNEKELNLVKLSDVIPALLDN